jgi:prevent-host-death family protein
MQIISVTEIRKRWSEVLARVSAGEEFVLTRRGKRIGRLKPPVAVGMRVNSDPS